MVMLRSKSVSYTHLDVYKRQAKGQPKYLIKYPGKSGSVTDAVSTVNPQDNDLCILRLSEVYLNAAEAAFKLGNTEKALTYLLSLIHI